MSPSTTADRARAWTAALGIALAAAWVMAPARHGSWLWDDEIEVARNAAIQSPSGWWRVWFAPAGMDYLPFKDTALWLQWRLWAGRVAGYHAVDLALHIASALLIWRLLTKLGVKHGWLGGLLFAVHPAAVASVAWIAEFKNTLSLPLLLGAMLAVVEAGDPPAGRRRRLFALLLFVLSLLAKASGVMFPALILLYAWWKRGGLRRVDFAAVLPFALASLACGAVTLWFQAHRAIGIGGALPSLRFRVVQSGWSVAADAAQCFVPARFMPVYAPIRVAFSPLLPWIAIGVVLGLSWRWRSTWGRHVLLGFGWFLLNLVPVLGLIPMSYLRIAPRADQFIYLPLVGLAGLAAAGWSAVFSHPDGAGRTRTARRLAAGCVAALAVAALATEARSYAAAFQGPEALWTYAVRQNPEAWLARNNLGRIFLDQGRPGEAEPQLAEAVRLEPDSAEARANWGNALAGLGRSAEAEEQLTAAIRIDPRLAGASYDLGVLLERAGRNAEAEDRFRAALAADPGYAKAHNNLGLALARQGRLAEAVSEYDAALALDPRLPEAWLNLGNVSFTAGRLDTAVDQYRRALAIDPAYGAAHRNLAYALERLGRFEEARIELDAAGRLPAGK